MSLINDYSFSVMSAQRQRELQREAREARLAWLATGNRTSWWRRLTGPRGRGRLSGAAAQRPVAIPQHPTAY